MSKNDEITKYLLKNARYKGEVFLNIVSIILTLLVNVALIYASYNLGRNPKVAEAVSNYTGISIDFIVFLSEFNSLAIIALLVTIFVLILYYNFAYKTIASLKNFDLDSILNQECYKLYEKYCKLLDIKTPILFLNNSVYDSSIFGVKIRGNKAIGISTKAYQEVVIHKDYHAFNYFVCSTLGSIYLGHYNVIFQLLTFWARIIPVYKKIYANVLCYSTDRVAQILIGTDALVTSIARETSGMFYLSESEAKNILPPDVLTLAPHEKVIARIYDLKYEYPLPIFRLKLVYENDAKDKELINKMNQDNIKEDIC